MRIRLLILLFALSLSITSALSQDDTFKTSVEANDSRSYTYTTIKVPFGEGNFINEKLVTWDFQYTCGPTQHWSTCSSNADNQDVDILITEGMNFTVSVELVDTDIEIRYNLTMNHPDYATQILVNTSTVTYSNFNQGFFVVTTNKALLGKGFNNIEFFQGKAIIREQVNNTDYSELFRYEYDLNTGWLLSSHYWKWEEANETTKILEEVALVSNKGVLALPTTHEPVIIALGFLATGSIFLKRRQHK